MIQLLSGFSIPILFTIAAHLFEKNDKSYLYKTLAYAFTALIIECVGIFLKITFGILLNMSQVYYEYLIYFGKAFAPTMFLLFALIYENPRLDIKRYSWLFFIPIFVMVSIFTNEFHHLFFVNYGQEVIQYGLLYYIYIGVTYLELIPAVLLIIRASMDRSRFSSPQTLLLILTCTIPFIPRIVSVISNIQLPDFIYPIVYSLMTLFIYINIKKYNVLSAVPIALKSVMDIISDAFVVINTNGDMVDMNHSFIANFENVMNLRINKNIYDVIKYEGIKGIKQIREDILEAEDKRDTLIREYHFIKDNYNKFFEVQIQPIRGKATNDFIATLLVFSDITEMKSNIDVTIKKENLSIIGELTGGVAHDINTPLTAIRSGLTILRQAIKDEDEIKIIDNMTNSADKISNLVNSLKNQMNNFGSNSDTEFSLVNLVQDLYAIMHGNLTRNNVRLDINYNEDIWVTGNTSKLVQVLNNIITNSVEAYGKKGGIIDINIYRDNNANPVIMIEDWAGGIKEEIRPYIFKKVIKVDGMPTAGIGLYLAYSVIKGSFGGDITFDTKTGRGTRFYITLNK